MKQLLVDSMLCFSFDRPVTDNCPILVLILDFIDSTISMTGPRLRLKCSAQDLSVDLLDMQDTQIYPFSHQSETFASSFLSEYVLSAVRLCSQTRHVTDCASRPGLP